MGTNAFTKLFTRRLGVAKHMLKLIMLPRMMSVWFRFQSDHPGFCSGTYFLITLMGLLHFSGVLASLSLGPGGDIPRLTDMFLYAFCHDDLPSLLVNVCLLLSLGRCQERYWGTVPFLTVSAITIALLPVIYTLVLFVFGGEATRVCGYSAVQLTLLTAHSRQVTTRRLMRCLPVWLLPWVFLLTGLLLLPGTPALLHFCSICVGHNYHHSFIRMFQSMEEAIVFWIPEWAYIPASGRSQLPIYMSSHRSLPQRTDGQAATAASVTDASVVNYHPWVDTRSAWGITDSAGQSDPEVLEEEMLRAGIMASLQDVPDNPGAKVQVPKSSVSSLRLQQLQKMGFPTEKAVVALAASKQLDDAISLLIDDRVGEEAVVVCKGKSSVPEQTTERLFTAQD